MLSSEWGQSRNYYINILIISRLHNPFQLPYQEVQADVMVYSSNNKDQAIKRCEKKKTT